MKPSEWLQSIKGNFPDANSFKERRELSNEDSRRFAALWLAEGIPFAFLEYPGAFQAARESLAQRLGISFRDISLVGSARIGYSLNPKKFGDAFKSGISDIDLFIVNEKWFNKLAEQAQNFGSDFKLNQIQPQNSNEERFWISNVEVNAKNIAENFIDAWKIPTLNQYPAVQQIQNSAYFFKVNINSWTGEELVNKCSVRTYRTWQAAIDQIGFNLRSAIKHRV